MHGSRRHLFPLYAAGFTTAFGAHAVAANLGACALGRGQSLLLLGAVPALYDGAEVNPSSVAGPLPGYWSLKRSIRPEVASQVQ
jgi:hypothetical protein